MAEEVARHRYGNVNAGGRTRLHQGDDNRHIVNHIEIETAYISLPDGIDLINLASPTKAQNSHAFIQSKQKGPGCKRSATNTHAQAPKRLETEGTKHDAWVGEGARRIVTTYENSVAQVQALQYVSRLCSAVRGENLKFSEETVWNIYEWICRVISRTSLRSFPFPTASKHGQPALEERARVTEEDERITHCQEPFPINGNYLIFCAGVLSCLLGRHISVQDLLAFLSRCREDQLLPMLTFMIGFGLCQYICTSSIGRLPPTGRFLTLEDAWRDHYRWMSVWI